MLRHQKRNCK